MSGTRSVFVVGAVVALAAFFLGRATAPDIESSVVTRTPGTPTPSLGLVQLFRVDESVLLLKTLTQVRKDGVPYLRRLGGVGYGQGFGDACDSLGASKADCDSAWQTANDACLELPGEDPICFDPLPGYFHLSDALETRMNHAYAKHIDYPIRVLACLDPVDAKVERLCAAGR